MWGFVVLVACWIPVEAAVYNIHLVTDNMPDFTSMQSLIWSATSRFVTDGEKMITLWRWSLECRRQTEATLLHGQYVKDPILFYNSFGNTFCSEIAGMNCAIWEYMGYPVKFIDIANHTISEVGYGGSFHMFDSSLGAFFRNHVGEVASTDEIAAADSCPNYNNGQSELGHLAFYHYGKDVATCSNGWLWLSGRPLRKYGEEKVQHRSYRFYYNNSDWGHRYVLNLRRFEHYTRYWEPQGSTDDYYLPNTDGVDPDETWGLNNIRGNGVWVFQPDLSSNEYRLAIWDESNIESASDVGAGPNLHPAGVGKRAFVIFKVYAANIVTSADIQARLVRQDVGDAARIYVSVNNGKDWQMVYEHTGAGAVDANVHLREPVREHLEYLVKVELFADGDKTDAGLESIRITTITQLNRRALPKLTLGSNRIQFFTDEQWESILLWPSLYNDTYKQDIVDEYGMHSEPEHPDWNAVLKCAVAGQDCWVTYRIDAPTDITHITYGGRFLNRQKESYVKLLHSFDGTNFNKDHLLSENDPPWDDKVFIELDENSLPQGAKSVWMKYIFRTRDVSEAYTVTGAYSLLMRVWHKPRDEAFVPVEVTYCWTEHRKEGDVTRTHTHLVTNPKGEEWIINVAGYKDPTMNWVRVNLAGYGPNGTDVTYGYSDGVDVGTTYERQKKIYHWGKNLALGKPYTYDVEPWSFNPDSGGELTDGVIGYCSKSYSPEIFPGLAIWPDGTTPEFTVDLEAVQQVQAFRVWSHAAHYGDGFVHPEKIEIEVSTGGQNYTPVGTITHDQLWDPPGDYIACEGDDSRQVRDWPQQGRLVYGFRLVLDTPVDARYVRFRMFPLEGKHMGFWELEVFDTVRVEDWDNGLALKDLPSTW